MEELYETGANVINDRNLEGKYIIRLARNNKGRQMEPPTFQPYGEDPLGTHGYWNQSDNNYQG